ncbi:hypothetical protein [Rubrivivax albus]|uniref:Ribbon-helix-helix protein, CopG family n=1 Tax=Rubrivivax albus TaxID=2499835 RepID=A0A3S2U4L5_9BURK|nr:hypothetical protein [Rubrivivax albus]RVT53451.1 hypothetical protein ENE75_00675 [Rubrivivax albus]
MKRITLRADERVIEAARRRARSEQTTLSAAFRVWLAGYALAHQRLQCSDDVLGQLRGQLQVGGMPGRDEMNAR